jgi:hypothetical protein
MNMETLTGQNVPFTTRENNFKEDSNTKNKMIFFGIKKRFIQFSKLHGKAALWIFLAPFLSVMIFGFAILIILGTSPCFFTQCHEKASCVNRPFRALCLCNYGWNGDGSYCDGLKYFKNLNYSKVLISRKKIEIFRMWPSF